MLRNERGLVAFCFLVESCLLAYFYIQPGWPRMGDGHGILAQTWLFRDAVRGGEWPGWTFFWYGGWGLTRAYGPLFASLPGSIDLLLENPKRSVILFALSSHILSLITSYLCARSLGLRRPSSLIVALFYSFCGQHAQTILRYGGFSTSLFYALLPLPFMYLVQTLRIDAVDWRKLFSASAYQFLLFLNHPELGAYSLIGTAGLGTLLTVLQPSTRSWKSISKVASWGLFSLFLSSFFLIQFFLTAEYTLLHRESLGLADTLFQNWQVPLQMMEGNYTPEHSWTIQYFGWLPLLLALVGGGAALGKKNLKMTALFLFTLALFVLLLFYSRGRPLHYWVLPLSLLIGFGFENVAARVDTMTGNRCRNVGSLAFFVVLSVYLLYDQCHRLPYGQYSFRPTVGYFESDKTARFFRDLKTRQGISGRTIQIRDSLEGTVWSDLEPVVTGFPTLAGGNIETAPMTWPYSAAFLHLLVDTIHEKKDPAIDLKSLSVLFGLRFIGFPSDLNQDFNLGSSLPSEDRYSCLELPDYSPVLGSREIQVVEKENALDRLPGSRVWRSDSVDPTVLVELFRRMGVHRETNTMDLLLLRKEPENPATPISDSTDTLSVDFLSERVRHTEVEIEFTATAPCMLRLAYPYDPRISVRLDGAAVETVPTAMSMMGVVCPGAGSHHLHLKAVFLPIEKFGQLLSLFTGFGMIAWLIFSTVRRPNGVFNKT